MTANTLYKSKSVAFALTFGLVAIAGCFRSQPPVTMAPPVGGGVSAAPPMGQSPMGQGAMQSGGEGMPVGQVFNWLDVPRGQEVPIRRAVFDQGGYQLFAASGETIAVPFANQNMYVMKFGKSTNGSMYFVNDGQAPTLYVPNGGYVENAAQANARWFPFSQDFRYERPVYMGIAPSWGEYVAMGWYPGMSYYGGYYGYRPWYPGFGGFTPMIGLNFNIGGRPYYGWNSYQSYYRSNPYNRVTPRSTFNYTSVGRSSPSAFGRGRAAGSTGSFGRTRGGSGSFGSGTAGRTGTGSFGAGRTGSGSFGSGGSFGRTSPGTGSFGRSSGGTFGSGGGSFGSSRPSFGGGSSGSFGSGTSGFGSSGRSRGSFGSGTSGFRSGTGSSGGSFGGFGSSRPSFGGSSGGSFGRSSGGFGGGGSFGRSSGGSFGRSSGGFGGRRR